METYVRKAVRLRVFLTDTPDRRSCARLYGNVFDHDVFFVSQHCAARLANPRVVQTMSNLAEFCSDAFLFFHSQLLAWRHSSR